MELIGTKADSFAAEAYAQGGIKTVKLNDYGGKWTVLLFYVADFSAVCPTEVIEFNKEYERFQSNGAELIGISSDSTETHKKLVDEKMSGTIRFPLVSDTDGAIARPYGLFDEGQKNDGRASVIIDPEGTIRYFCVTDNKVGRSTNELYRVLMALKSGEACAVNWTPILS